MAAVWLELFPSNSGLLSEKGFHRTSPLFGLVGQRKCESCVAVNSL